MPDFVTLTCPSCGGRLQITSDVEQFACGHCGNQHVVHRGGGIVSLAPMVQELKSIKSGVDKTASELAIQRLNNEISKLEGAIRDLKHTMTNTQDDRFNEYTSSGLRTLVESVFIPNLSQVRKDWENGIKERRERLNSLEEALKQKQAELKWHKQNVEM